MLFHLTYRNHPPYSVVEDNKDGTLETVEYRESTWLLGRVSISRNPTGYIIKKCIQGQVYRAEQNDCKGKGTQADWWGAEKFQWCPTNDRACEIRNSDGSYDFTKSPAYATCNNDTTTGKKWQLISLDYYSQLAYYTYIQKMQLDEIPTGNGYFYWWWSTNETDALVFSLNESWTSSNYIYTYVKKNTFHYALCTKIKGT